MQSVRRPWWQQATALATVSTGVITGFNFVPGAAATMNSPTSVPLHLLALEQAARPGAAGDLAAGVGGAARVTANAQLRTAIVNVARYCPHLARTGTPAQMEALTWDKTSGARRCTGRPSTRPTPPTGPAAGSVSRSARSPSSSPSATRPQSPDRKRR